MVDRIVEIWPTNFVLNMLIFVLECKNFYSYTISYVKLIDHKIDIDSLTNFRDIVNFVDFPINLMTKYGYESGSIAISHLKAGIDDKNHLSNKIIQIHTIFTLIIACQTNYIKFIT